MRYRSVRFTQNGKDTLRRLHIHTQRNIKRALKAAIGKPNNAKALLGKLLGFFSLRVGAYRAVYVLASGASARVILVGHRSRVYNDASKSVEDTLRDAGRHQESSGPFFQLDK